jgi:opacity protein-like surface antigen
MRNYSKWIAGVFCALTILSTTAFAATNEQASLFNAGETGLTLSTGYTVDPSAAFQSEYSFNLTAGLYHYLTRNIGVEVNVPFYSTKGASVTEVQAGLLARLPLSSNVPLFRNFAPYIGLGGVYNWNTVQDWAYVAKAGVEVRLNKNWGIFTEYQFRNSDFNWSKGEQRVAGGLKFTF